ncbi:uncharacterized protein LOC114187196 [Vigna unguiculata]|uniref:Uncharacterized protein n=1 Tax=Vigna unguiculata TaxID=3917 RepID=A0A4D6KIV7_VIGUN|nr:uncharacterized protein LOC114187196 [Vigna unguiculata]XP_027931167.1 uncharacterized protein LOC114187196 [Vigna unguiculata]XP_027931168.1 uncharacterized protein LOC114187196 [Vigna unguiculata]XP_027931169.1 uncharacterized protein LOC114187196 [Vigna unguiculata]XP_027931170.1 uncharacterized protein LOC114187196 [Vigna unguiculata]XP_027931171.1 uncharacterized protein LOC114187196 [Vigna unguiculata]QCD76400.1 hypothetical protein DEO72_LG1g19 [Vigna unguiculata]
MSDLNGERSKAWNIYPSSNPGPSSQRGVDEEGPWKSLGTSMSAISFGFVATAILISMFLIMAIFEHLFKPTPQSMMPRYQDHPKQPNAQPVPPCYANSDFSVVMPGHQYPTYIAQPAPLPCQREGAYWPSHEHHFVFN